MLVKTTRFGELDVSESSLVEFPDGLIGLPGTRYLLIATDEQSPFLWLQSIELPELALPVTIPWLFFSNYAVRVNDEDENALGVKNVEDIDVLCVVRATSMLEEFTINLAGPILIHRTSRRGRQIVNDEGSYAVRQPLFSEVQLSDVRPAAEGVSLPATAV